MSQAPVLPYGSPTTLSGISENFSFHSSPENFIAARVLSFHKAHPRLADSRTPIRAKVLNRNVAVLSSFENVSQVLRDEAITKCLSSSQAYDELMAPFFPPPNLLLLDPPDHPKRKDIWLARITNLNQSIRSIIYCCVVDHFRSISSGSMIDLYDSMKSLSWRILLTLFLRGKDHGEGGDFVEIEALQDDLLRGQFSLFPISITTPFWRSPRSKGLKARQQLQSLLRSQVAKGKCPFAVSNAEEEQDVANHMLLFTSSLAAKAIASLLTAVLLNLFLFKEAGVCLRTRIKSLEDPKKISNYIQSLVLETERLSPPVVGIMRRTTQKIVLQHTGEQTPSTLVPKGWDIWLYFLGAGRDHAVFGETAEEFIPSRYYDAPSSQPEGFAFGAGAKSCLGKDLMRMVAITVVETCMGEVQSSESTVSIVEFEGDGLGLPAGVQGWLGWQSKIKPGEWARDIKQLPTQRPRKPIMVKLKHQVID
ncbi:MAG: hypothetical protein Q9182_002567 [Xanthomendoza sp. 2 TL-2023]